MMKFALSRNALATALGALALSAATGAAFAAWMGQGPEILLSLAASGLSWCF